ncbi:hypothetical protein C8J56DRAFT_1061491 [Mycena floridula]|nr:hypothetical protein C8J56DRAFT_1061491 [Mycena floridula]
MAKSKHVSNTAAPAATDAAPAAAPAVMSEPGPAAALGAVETESQGDSPPNKTAPAKQKAPAVQRPSNPGNFSGEKLEMLERWAADFCETRKKPSFFVRFFPAWEKAFPHPEVPTVPVVDDGSQDADALKVAEGLLEARDVALAKEDKQIRAWFKNRQTKENRMQKNPFGLWLTQLSAHNIAPWRKEVHKFYMQLDKYSGHVAAEFTKRWGVLTGREEVNLALSRHVAVAKELYEAEDEMVREELVTDRDAKYDKDVEEHKKFLKTFHMDSNNMGDGMQFSKDLKAECRGNLAAVIQPLLNALHALTGQHFMLVGGAPPKSAEQGEKWSLTALHTGRTLVTKKTFVEWDTELFRNDFMSAFMGFLWCVGQEQGAIPKAAVRPGPADGVIIMSAEPEKESSSIGAGPTDGNEMNIDQGGDEGQEEVPVGVSRWSKRKKNKRGKRHTSSTRHSDSETSDSEINPSGDSDGSVTDKDKELQDIPDPQIRHSTPSLPDGHVLGAELRASLETMDVQPRRARLAQLASLPRYKFDHECNIARKDA